MKLRFTFLSIFITNIALAQDTTVYCRPFSSYYSDCIYFHKKNRSDNSGTFTRRHYSDDATYQIYYGSFARSGRSFYLNIDKIERNGFKGDINNGYIKDTLHVSRVDTMRLSWQGRLYERGKSKKWYWIKKSR